MEIFRFNILPLQDIERREAFKNAVNQCPLCSQSLEFKHEVDYLENKVNEEAKCPHCQILVRENKFSIQ